MSGPDERVEEGPDGRALTAGDVVRDRVSGARFKLVPLPDPSVPGEPLTEVDELRGQVERLRGEVRAVQGEARDNATAIAELRKRVEALEGVKVDA